MVVYSRGDRTHSGTVHDQGIEFRYTSASAYGWERRFVNGLINLEYLTSFPRRKRPIFATRWFHPFYIEHIARDLSREHWDIIHITAIPPFVISLRHHNPTSKIIIHMHTLWLSQFDPAIVRRYLQAADFVLTVSDFVTDAFRASFPDQSARCQTLHNGADVERLIAESAGRISAPIDQPHLLFVGRVSPEKGVHVLIEAFRQVAARCPKAELHIVGGTQAIGYHYLIPMDDDPIVRALARFYHPITKRDRYLPALRAMIPDELRQQVRIHGSVPNDELKNHLSQATAFISSSVWSEPFSMALIEGLASGVPVVSTRSGGSAELIEDGVNGLLVERNDPDSLAHAILRLIDDPALCVKLGKTAQARVKALLSWDHTVAQLLDVYERLQSSHGTSN